METQQIVRRTAWRSDSSDAADPSSSGLSEIQASCRRLADAADAEIERALSGTLTPEQYNQSTRQMTGGQ
jgi:hypothetical protein